MMLPPLPAAPPGRIARRPCFMPSAVPRMLTSSILRTWAADHRGGLGTTPELTALAERISGQDLQAFFQTWLWWMSARLPVCSKSFLWLTTTRERPPAKLM